MALARPVGLFLVQGYVLDKGAPIITINGPGQKLSSRLLKEVCDLLGTKKIHTSPYHPQSHGMVEWLNRTPMSMLCHQVSTSQTDWDLFVPGVLAVYRLARHASTGFSPFYLMYCRVTEYPNSGTNGPGILEKRGPQWLLR